MINGGSKLVSFISLVHTLLQLDELGWWPGFLRLRPAATIPHLSLSYKDRQHGEQFQVSESRWTNHHQVTLEVVA